MSYVNRIKTSDTSFFAKQTIDGITTKSSKVVKQSSVRSGQRMPDWKEKIRLGQNASTPFSFDGYKLLGMTYAPEGLTASCVRAYNQPIVQSGNFTGYASAPPNSFDHINIGVGTADSAALTALYKKMNGQISHMNAIASFLEVGDVLRQFGSPFKSIIQLTDRHINRLFLENRGIRALRYNKAQALKRMADVYLEYAFGLAPLINDTRKAAEALARWQLEKDGEVRMFKKSLTARGGESKATTQTTSAGFGRNNVVLTTTATTTTKRVQYVIGLGAIPAAVSGSTDRLNQLLGFRPESWIPAVWEAVPWSWLVDYFTNVQDILQSLEASVVKPTWICKTVSTVTDLESYSRLDFAATLKAARTSQWNDPISIIGSECSRWKCRKTTVERTIPTTLGFPSVHYKLPNSVRQMANMAAVLITQQRSLPMISLETNMRNFNRK